MSTWHLWCLFCVLYAIGVLACWDECIALLIRVARFDAFRKREPWIPTPEQQAKIDEMNRRLATSHGISTDEAIRRLVPNVPIRPEHSVSFQPEACSAN